MTSKSSHNVLSIKEDKLIILEPGSFNRPCSDSNHLCSQNKFLPRSLWYKGSRDRGLREDVAA